MSKLPDINIKSSSLYSGTRNDKGLLCNIYTPLLNLADETTKKLGDFTTEDLDFDMEHPVDIILQDSYDGAVNMVINDGKNRPRLINSRFSVQDENTFKIPDHSGFKDTNIYDEETFDVDTQLKAIPIKIPTVRYDGLLNNAGKLSCGTYTFFFKLSDADGNETEVIAESGLVLCHIGYTNSPDSIRMGLLDENSSKAIKFTLSNIDAGFDYIRVLFSRSSSADDLALATTYHKILFDYPVSKEGVCEITVTGSENIIGISKEECNVDYADINSVKTQAVNNNVLLFGNVDTPEHDWDAIKRFTWKIIPRWSQTAEGAIGSLDSNYQETSISKDQIEENGFCYYNTKNVYYRLGYWPDEIYRFGIVYIFTDNSLSPVINLLGVDFLSTNGLSDNRPTNDQASDYECVFFTEEHLGNGEESRFPEYLYEEDGLYFNKKYRTNSRGVIKFHKDIDVKNVKSGVMVPKPLYINFDLSLIGYKYARLGNRTDWIPGDVTDWKDVLKQHNIKGFFFVRQKRVPTVLGLGIIIGLSNKLCGSLPVIKNNFDQFVVLPFIDKYRLIEEKAEDFGVPANKKLFVGKDNEAEDLFKYLALLCPDAEIDEATFNQLFVSNEFSLLKDSKYLFEYDSNSHTSNISTINILQQFKDIDKRYKAKLTNVPENTKTLSNGSDYFSTLAGNPNEPYKTVDILNAWKWTTPLNLTESTSLLRGLWGPFVGLSNPNENSPLDTTCPFLYGEVYNIKNVNYLDSEAALDLDFWKAMNSTANFFAISDRMEMTEKVDCFRGDCYISMFTHRMFRNFVDPELPTNHQIVDPACWAKNYAVRCTALMLASAHSNLTSDSEGFYISDSPYKLAAEAMDILAAVYFLTLNIIGGIIASIQATKFRNLIGTEEEKKLLEYPNGYANEIVLAFEVYTGGAGATNAWFDTVPKYNGNDITDYRPEITDNTYYSRLKKVNPKEQELSGGINLKAIFKSDDNWDLRGLASINRADINAVAMGLWITFPILSNKNLALRDVDFSNATEEASFNRKRSFYPLSAKEMENPLRDSNVINQAAAVTLPTKPYIQLPKVPYFKQEYFTRINNSLRDSSSSVTNEFKVMLESAYHDYTKTYGSITKLESKGNYVFIIFKHGIGILDMSAAIANAQDATQFLPEVSIISDTYGSIWKDSIVQTPYGIYGVDSVAKVIWRIQGTEVKIISDMKVEKFLIDNLDMSEFNFRPYIGHINIKSHYNAFKHDVMFTYYNDLVYELPSMYPSSKGFSVDLDGFVIDSDGSRYSTDKEGNKTLYGKATRLLPQYDEDNQKWQSYSDIIKDKDYQWVKGTNWSLCWNEDLQEFQTFYDWIPVESENIDNIYFSFDRDGIDGLKDNTEKYVLEPKFYLTNLPEDSTVSEWYFGDDFNIGIIQKKYPIDSSFTNDTKVYNVKTLYKDLALLLIFDNVPNNSSLVARFTPNIQYDYGVFSFYLNTSGEETKIKLDNTTIMLSTNLYPQYRTNEWIFVSVYLNHVVNQIDIWSSDSFLLCEPKLMPYNEMDYNSDGYSLEILNKDTDGKLFKSLYDIRTTDNSMKLWKHGQSGVYDNLGKIRPTHWYGKQHEFNFEFVVNENSSILKIFNNLKIISNKAEPYKFEYEIVGEGYEWFEYKPIVYWINERVKDGTFTDLDSGYMTVLSTPYDLLRSTYLDFPDLFYYRQHDSNWKIYKLPYFEIKLADKKGLPDKDKSYTKKDIWSDLDKSVGQNDYKLNTSEAIIVEDTQLNEYRVHTESYGNNMKKYGRVRGNMEYLEDLWDIEIRPIPVKWAYLVSNGSLDKKIFETRHRDKYIKIKVRYTGEDLVIIQAIQTMFDYSFA